MHTLITLLILINFSLFAITYSEVIGKKYIYNSSNTIEVINIPANLSTLEIRPISKNPSNDSSFVKDWFAPILGFIGVIVGGLLTYFVGVLKQRPFNYRVKQMAYYELKGYKTLLESIKKSSMEDGPIILPLSENDDRKLELDLKDKLTPNYWMSREQINIFDIELLKELDLAYNSFREHITKILEDLPKQTHTISIDSQKNARVIGNIAKALDSLGIEIGIKRRFLNILHSHS